jgi:hypothetical protein
MQPNLVYLYEPTPVWLDTSLVILTLLTIGLLAMAFRRVSVRGATRLLIASLLWMTILGFLAYNHVFQQLDAMPPRFVLANLPLLLLIVGLLLSRKARAWMDKLPLSVLTLLHTIRVPVELTLYALYLHQQIPQLMTFEGRNFDILAGLTAPIVAYLAFSRKNVSALGLLVWNIFALGLVTNIVAHAVVSAPMPFQQMAFEQPNVAVLKAPYVWLPGIIVPAVLFSHAVAIQRLVKDVFGRKRMPSHEPHQATALR